MKLIKLFSFATICLSMVLLTACSLFKGGPDSIPMEPASSSSGSGQLESGDLTADFGTQSDTLPERPVNQWTPIPGKVLPTVYFAYDQSNIGSSEISKLETTAKYLKNDPNTGVIIEGHCDERGSAEYNIGLGEKRALAVRDYLNKLGIPERRMQTISYGSERPADPGHNENSWLKNRRADLIPANM